MSLSHEMPREEKDSEYVKIEHSKTIAHKHCGWNQT